MSNKKKSDEIYKSPCQEKAKEVFNLIRDLPTNQAILVLQAVQQEIKNNSIVSKEVDVEKLSFSVVFTG